MEEKTKLNMQMYDAESILAPLQKLNLMDDFLFDAATGDLETCRIIIELSLGIRIRNIAWKEGQKVIRNLPGNRGIRMDFYVEDDRGRVFDVEMQKRNEGNIPKRTRFYQALVDAPMLKSGERAGSIFMDTGCTDIHLTTGAKKSRIWSWETNAARSS